MLFKNNLFVHLMSRHIIDPIVPQEPAIIRVTLISSTFPTYKKTTGINKNRMI